MADQSFFEEQKDQSEAKARIIQKYLWAWANVILSQQHVSKIAYIDLFAGPGRYKDGAKSTPILVLETAIQDDKIRNALVTIFNDKEANSTSTLRQIINALPGIDSLRYKPKIQTSEVGTEIVKLFEEMTLIPTLFFVDPWGYKGLSLRLINSVLKNWGCDCVFFFNYNRINMGITNTAIEPHMAAIFGDERLPKMAVELESLDPEERELYIIEQLCQELKECSDHKLYILPFRFRKPDHRTSHHLIFASKNFKGYDIMKGIMAKESSNEVDEVPSFEYSPAGPMFPLLYSLSKPLEGLKDMLRERFAGCTVSVARIYEEHSVGTCFISKHYKMVLKEMEEAGEVSVSDPQNKKRPKGTLADRLLITFPV